MDPYIELVDNCDEWIEQFDDMGLTDNLLRGIYSFGYEKPSEVQGKAIRLMAQGKDVRVQSQSGTGKTSAMVIGVLSRIDPTLKQTQAIFLSPTRELSTQLSQLIVKIGSFLNVTSVCLTGGVPFKQQIQQIQTSPHVIVGTPGRTLEMIKRKVIDMTHLSIFAMDEVDELLNRGFGDAITEILPLLPVGVQIIQSGVTYSQAYLLLTNPYIQNVINVIVRQIELTLDGIKQLYVTFSNEEDKPTVLLELYQLANIQQCMIFCNNEGTVEELYDQITKVFQVGKILKSMPQIDKQSTLQLFKQGAIRCLISDHVIKSEQFAVVINYQFPLDKLEYLLRIGRSGAYGRKGLCINFVTPIEAKLMMNVEKYFNTQITEMELDLGKLDNYI